MRKLLYYFRVPSIAHYLTGDLELKRIGHHRRGPNGSIVTATASGGTLFLDPPGLTGLFGEARDMRAAKLG